ncbi:MAG: cysteine desulfurase family protein [Bacteroidota bacterium]
MNLDSRIYLDNAASTPLDPEVFSHMQPWFLQHPGNPSSTHAYGRPLRNAIEAARRDIAKVIGAQTGEIFFTSGGTEADNLAIKGAVCGLGHKHIISSPIEHHAVTHTIENLVEKGEATVSWLQPDAKGNIDLQALEDLLKTHPKSLVSLMHGNNEIGTLNDIQAIGALCESYGALFHSDTVQTMGNLPINVQEINVHFLAASAHKFNGPKGTGFLFVRRGYKIPAQIDGGSQERNLRAGTENVASIVGMAAALQKCDRMMKEKQAKLWELKQHMKSLLETAFPDVRFNGETEPGKSLPTVLNVAFPCGEDDAMLLFNLDLAGIAVSGGSACNSGANIGSHVLRGIGADRSALINSVRFSFGSQNTKAEINQTLEQLKAIVKTPAM